MVFKHTALVFYVVFKHTALVFNVVLKHTAQVDVRDRKRKMPSFSRNVRRRDYAPKRSPRQMLSPRGAVFDPAHAARCSRADAFSFIDRSARNALPSLTAPFFQDITTEFDLFSTKRSYPCSLSVLPLRLDRRFLSWKRCLALKIFPIL